MLIDPALAACPVVYPMPAVVSSLCCGAFNLATFRFCGECGTQRPRTDALPDKLPGCIDWDRVHANADRFAEEAAATAHRAADDSAISSFAAFLSSLPSGGIDIMQAKPGHVVLYLGYRTSHTAAQTVMHDITCDEQPGCGCPKMMKFTTLESLLRRLRRNLSEQSVNAAIGADEAGWGRGAPHHVRLPSGDRDSQCAHGRIADVLHGLVLLEIWTHGAALPQAHGGTGAQWP
jgi:hypothetical protein